MSKLKLAGNKKHLRLRRNVEWRWSHECRRYAVPRSCRGHRKGTVAERWYGSLKKWAFVLVEWVFYRPDASPNQWTVSSEHPVFIFRFFISLFCLAPCSRLSWLFARFWAHVNVLDHIISHSHQSLKSLFYHCDWITSTSGILHKQINDRSSSSSSASAAVSYLVTHSISTRRPHSVSTTRLHTSFTY